MITLWLWRALIHPPATHPVFQRTVVLPVENPSHYLSWANFVISLVIGLSRYAPTLLFLLLPLILVALGLTYGLDCALRVSLAITRERGRATFDLLALTPPGVMGAMWALCTSALYRRHDFMRLREIVRASLVGGVWAGVVITGILLFLNSEAFTRFTQPNEVILTGLANFLVILGAVRVEYIQSAVLGVLLGMAVASATANRLDGSLWAFGLYLLLQGVVYVITLALGFMLLPLVYDRLHFSGAYALMSLSLLRLLIFAAAREALIGLVWRALRVRLNVTPPELVFMSR